MLLVNNYLSKGSESIPTPDQGQDQYTIIWLRTAPFSPQLEALPPWGECPREGQTLSRGSCFHLRLYCSAPFEPQLLLPVHLVLDPDSWLVSGLTGAVSCHYEPAHQSWGCVWCLFTSLCLILTPTHKLMSQHNLDPSLSPQRCLMLQTGDCC